MSKYYFEDHTQRLRMTNVVSKKLFARFGAPQGSVLGPLLYSIYVANLLRVLSAGWFIYCYPDDVQWYKSCPPKECISLIEELNTHLNGITE